MITRVFGRYINEKVKKTIRKISVSTLEGSYSVEAAFIIPIVLAIIFVLIQLSLHLSDRIVMQGVLYRTTMYAEDYLRGSVNENRQYDMRQMVEDRQFLQGDDEKKAEAAALRNLITEQESRLLFSALSNQEVIIKSLSMQISFQMKSRNLLPDLTGWLNWQDKTVVYEAKRTLLTASRKTRISSVVLDTGKKLKIKDFGGKENGTGS